MNWQEFELYCTDYLNETFSDYATFRHLGFSDSSVPDILVTTKSDRNFYIEVKQGAAQSGQFVIIPNDDLQQFVFSPRNRSEPNEITDIIISYVNSNYLLFKNCGTSGETIAISPDHFATWIVNNYRNKDVKYVITDGPTIFPIEEFGNFFTISCCLRRKGSGSKEPAYSNWKMIKDFINESISNAIVSTEAGKIFVTSKTNLHDKRFSIGNSNFMLSKRGTNLYEIRQLSSTKNPTVIFQISQISTAGLSNSQFINYLR